MKNSTLVAVFFAVSIGLALGMPITDVQAQNSNRHKAQRQPSASAPNRAVTKAPHRVVQHLPIGHQVRSLPRNNRVIRVNRNSYRYYNGTFYRPGSQDVYVVISAPLGARVGYLPPGYISFFIGPRRYFYGNFTYYLWDEARTEYIVVEEPDGAEAAVVTASETESVAIFVYPNHGQSDEQRDRDRYECYLWAVEQTGFDPSAVDPQVDETADYRRAISACLEGRDYTVH